MASKKEIYKAVPSYVKNVGKSIMYSSRDAIRDITPSISEFVSQNAELTTNVVNDIRNFKTTYQVTRRNIEQSKVVSALGEIKKSMKEDIKTGKFYNPERQQEMTLKAANMEDMFDMSDLDFDDTFDSDPGSMAVSKAVTVNSLASTKATTTTMVDVGSRIASTTAASAEYMVENQKSMQSIQMTTNYKMFENITQYLSSMTSNIQGLFDYTKNISSYFDKSISYYNDSHSLMDQLVALNKEVTEMQRNVYGSMNKQEEYKETQYQSVFSGGTFDIKAYMENIKKNTSNVIAETFGGMMGMAGEDSNPLLYLAGSPLSFLSKKAADSMMSKDFKKSLESLNSTFGNFFQSGLLKIHDMGANTDNPLLEYASKILGLAPTSTGMIKANAYEKGPMPFNGMTNIAITEVIPTYLRKILSAITGSEEKIFNYADGKFMNQEDVKKRYEDDVKSSYNGMSGIKNNVVNALSSIKFGDKESNEMLEKDVDKFFRFLVDGNIFYNPAKDGDYQSMRERGLDLTGADKTYKLIQSAFLSLPKSEYMKMNTDIYNTKASRKDFVDGMNKNLYATGSSSLFNDSGINEYVDTKSEANTSSVFKPIDIYNKSSVDYLRDIRTILLEGIKVFTFNAGDSDAMILDNYDKLDSRLVNYKEEARNLRKKPKTEDHDPQKYAESMKKKALSLDGKFIDDIADVDGMSVAKLATLMTSSLASRNKDENEDNLLKSTFKNTKTKKALDTLKEGVQSLVQIPSNFVKEIATNVDQRMYELIYGKDDKGTNVGMVDGMIGGMKTSFTKFDTWLHLKILTPLNDKLFGKTGLITTMTDKLNPKLSMFKNKSMDFLFGSKDFDGRRDGGLLYGIRDQLFDMGSYARNILTGKDFYSRVTGQKISYNEDSVVNNMKSTFSTFSNMIGKTLFGDKEEYVAEDGSTAYRRKGDGLVSEVTTSIKDTLGKVSETLFGTSTMKDGVNKLYNEKVKSYLPKVGAGSVLGLGVGLLTPFGLVGSTLLGAGAGFVAASDKAKNWLFGDYINGEYTGGIVSKNVQDKFKKYAPSIASGGLLGAGAGILMPGSMLPWMFLGSGLGFASKSESFKRWMFGDDEHKGIVSKDFREKLKKYAPSAIGTGMLGAGAGLLLPGSMLTWSILGSGLGIAKESESFKDWMFGKKNNIDGQRTKGGMINKQFRDKFKKVMPAGVAGLIGANFMQSGLGAFGSFLLPGGPIGASLIGLSVGIASQSDKVKSFLFGNEDPETKKREGGIFGKLKLWFKFEIAEPLKLQMKDTRENVRHWFVTNLFNPIKDSVAPVKKQFELIGQGVKDTFKEGFGRLVATIDGIFERAVGVPFRETMQKHVLDPLKKFTSKLFNGIGKLIGTVISAPIKGINMLAMGFLDDHQRKKVDTYYDDWKAKKDKRDRREDTIHRANKNIINMDKDDYNSGPVNILRQNDYDITKPGVKEALEAYNNSKKPNDSKSTNKNKKPLRDSKGNIIPSPNTSPNDIAIENLKINKSGFDNVADKIDNICKVLKDDILNNPKAPNVLNMSGDVDTAYDNISKVTESSKPLDDILNNPKAPNVLNMGGSIDDKYDNINKATDSSRPMNEQNEAFNNQYNKNNRRTPKFKTRPNNVNEDIPDNVVDFNEYKSRRKQPQQSKNQPPQDSEGESKSYTVNSVFHDKDKQYTSDISDALLKSVQNIEKYTKTIKNEIDGQLDGVGYNLSMVANILIEQFGYPSIMPKGLFGRGNKAGKGIFGRITSALSTLIKRPLDFIKGVLGKPLKKIGTFVNSVFSKVGKVVDEIITLPGKVINAFTKVADIFAQTIKPVAMFMTKTIQTAFNGIITVVNGLRGVFKGVGEFIGESISSFGKMLGKATVGLFDMAAGFMKVTAHAIPDLILGLYNVTKAITKTAFNVGKSVIKGITSPIRSLLGQKTEYIATEVVIKGGKLDTVNNVNTVTTVEKVVKCVGGHDMTYTEYADDGVSSKVTNINDLRKNKKKPVVNQDKQNGKVVDINDLREKKQQRVKKDINYVNKQKQEAQEKAKQEMRDKVFEKTSTSSEGTFKVLDNTFGKTGIFSKIGTWLMLLLPKALELGAKLMNFFKNPAAALSGLIDDFLGKFKLPSFPSGGSTVNQPTNVNNAQSTPVVNQTHTSGQTVTTLPVNGKQSPAVPQLAVPVGNGKGKTQQPVLSLPAPQQTVKTKAKGKVATTVGKFKPSVGTKKAMMYGGTMILADQLSRGISNATDDEDDGFATQMAGGLASSYMNSVGIGAYKTVRGKVANKSAESLGSMITKILKSDAASKVMGPLSKHLTPIANFLRESIEKLAPNVVKKIVPKVAAKLGVNIGAGALTGGIATAVIMGIDGMLGVIETKNILQLPPDSKPTGTMRLCAALAKFIENNITFGFVPITLIAKFIYNLIASDEDKAKLTDMDLSMKANYAQYARETSDNGGEVKSFEEYNNTVNKGILAKTGDTIVGAGKSAWNGISNFGKNLGTNVANMGKTAWSGITKFGSNVGTTVANVGKSAWSGVTNFANKTVDFAKNHTALAGLNDDKVRSNLGLNEGVELNWRDRLATALGTRIETLTLGKLDGAEISKYANGKMIEAQENVKKIWNLTTESVQKAGKAVDDSFGALIGFTDDDGNPVSLTQGIKNGLSSAKKDIVTMAHNIQTVSSNLWEGTKTTFKNMADSVAENVPKAIASVDQSIGAVMGFTDDDGNPISLSSGISNGLNSAKKDIVTMAKFIQTSASNMWNSISTNVKSFTENVKEAIPKALSFLDKGIGAMLGFTDKDGNAVAMTSVVKSGWEATKNYVKEKVASFRDDSYYDAIRKSNFNAASRNMEQLGKGSESTTTSSVGGGDTINGMVYYSQSDPRWGKVPYAVNGESGDIAAAGCGPTSAAMVLSSITGQVVTPEDAAKYSLARGHKVYNNGTSWGFFKDIGSKYGVNFEDGGTDPSTIKSALAQRRPVILTGMGSAPFTKGGHFVVAAGINSDGTKVMINDPVSAARSKEYSSSDVFSKIRNSFIPDKSLSGSMPSTGSVGGATTVNGQTQEAQPTDSIAAALTQIGKLTAGFADATIRGEVFDPSKLEQQTSEYGHVGAVSNSTGTLTAPNSSYDMSIDGLKLIGTSSKGNPVYAGAVRSLGTDPNKFIELIAPQAVANQQEFGVPASTTISQAALESGWGKHTILNNVFGIKEGSSYKGPVINTRTKEYSAGVIDANFRGYNGILAGIKDHGQNVIKGNPQYYSRVITKDWQNSIEGLYPNYTDDPSYIPNLKSIVTRYDLTKYNNISNLGNGPDTPAKPTPTPKVEVQAPKVMDSGKISEFIANSYKRVTRDVDNTLTSDKLYKENVLGMDYSRIVELLETIADNTGDIKTNTETIASKDTIVKVENTQEAPKVTNNTTLESNTAYTNPFAQMSRQDPATKQIKKGYDLARSIATGIKQ